MPIEPDDLYGLPLEQFTERRNALAKQLRADGRRDEAEEVSKLRKPSLTAWAVNQLVRTQKRDLARLITAGDGLQKSQADLLAGRGNAASLRRAVESERAAVEQLTGKARGLLSSEGHELNLARLEQVSETLHAAALDPEARARVQDGRLERELRHVGLGGGGGDAMSPAPARPARPKAEQKRDALQRAAKAKAARQAEAHARRRAQRATRDVQAAEERRERAAAALEEAEAAVERARTEAAAAAEALKAAETASGQ